AGKSSLVMAGLCPALRWVGRSDGRPWGIVTLRPGTRPCEALACALMELGASSELRAEMLAGPKALEAAVNQVVVVKGAVDKLLIVVDQLEELFTEGQLGHGQGSAEALAFVRNLIEATQSGGALWVVVTLRADFVHRCLEIPELARALKSGAYI